MRPPMNPELAELRGVLERAGDVATAAPNYGRQVVMNTAPSGAQVTVQDTQLVSARVDAPKQWMITLAQVLRAGQTAPWSNNFDGGVYDNTKQFGAPVIPQLSGGGNPPTGLLQTRIRWGAGGVRYQAAFDYPLAGGAFALTADTVDLDVQLRYPGAQTPIDAAQVPVVGAFMVEGQPSDPTPLRWLEAPVLLVPAGAGASWSIKPFARKLHVIATNATKAVAAWSIISGVPGNTAAMQQLVLVEEVAGKGIDSVITVPATAEIFGISILTSTGGLNALTSLEWQLGLS